MQASYYFRKQEDESMSMCGSCPLYWDEDEDYENENFGITCEGNTDRETCVYNY